MTPTISIQTKAKPVRKESWQSSQGAGIYPWLVISQKWKFLKKLHIGFSVAQNHSSLKIHIISENICLQVT